ncbi:MAG: penicillin-binding transpeptidase domain-containing protein, partial [Flavisolibacter sp.]
GEVRAWVGGIDFKTYKLDHANLNTKRQVGSAIKPLLYCQAIAERGFTPETMVEDVQQSFGKGQLVPATGKTCTGRTMTMASALAWSRNCATAYIMKQVTPAQFSNFLERINIPTHVEPYPSIALGSCDLSLYEMMWGYSIFPGNGFSTRPSFISRIEDRNGNVIKRYDFGANRKEVVNEVAAYQTLKMMEGPVTVGTAAGLMQRLGAKEMGGKTGTTNNNADFWFMGATPQLLAGTWVGSDDRFIQIESAAFFGGTAARPIWEAFFKKVYADKSLGIRRDAEFSKPAELGNNINDADEMIYWDPIQMDSANLNGSKEDEYGLDTTTYIPAESKVPDNEEDLKKDKPKKDTSSKTPRIGEMNTTDKKDKKGLLRKIFGKKDEKKDNEY